MPASVGNGSTVRAPAAARGACCRRLGWPLSGGPARPERHSPHTPAGRPVRQARSPAVGMLPSRRWWPWDAKGARRSAITAAARQYSPCARPLTKAVRPWLCLGQCPAACCCGFRSPSGESSSIASPSGSCRARLSPCCCCSGAVAACCSSCLPRFLLLSGAAGRRRPCADHGAAWPRSGSGDCQMRSLECTLGGRWLAGLEVHSGHLSPRPASVAAEHQLPICRRPRIGGDGGSSGTAQPARCG
jgi:hypothetical protein